MPSDLQIWWWRLQSGDPVPWVIVGIVAIVLIAVVAGYTRRQTERRAKLGMVAETMIETASYSIVGGVCVLLLLANWLVAVFLLIVARTGQDQLVALLIWIGGSVFFGVGVLAGRRRQMLVYRQNP